jgi:hypothetical protein
VSYNTPPNPWPRLGRGRLGVSRGRGALAAAARLRRRAAESRPRRAWPRFRFEVAPSAPLGERGRAARCRRLGGAALGPSRGRGELAAAARLHHRAAQRAVGCGTATPGRGAATRPSRVENRSRTRTKFAFVDSFRGRTRFGKCFFSVQRARPEGHIITHSNYIQFRWVVGLLTQHSLWVESLKS